MLRLKNPEQPGNVEKFIYDYAVASYFINILKEHSKKFAQTELFKRYKS